MRSDSPTPEDIEFLAKHEATLKEKQERIDVYMQADDLNDIPAVSFFKGLQDQEVLS